MSSRIQKWMCLFGFIALGLSAPSRLDSAIPINTKTLADATVFLYSEISPGSMPIGTGFFVDVPIKSTALVRRYLTTARHILDPIWAKQCTSSAGSVKVISTNPVRLYARINKRVPYTQPGFTFVEIPLVKDGKPAWHHHVNPMVDAAVIDLTIDGSSLQWDGIPLKDFPTSAEILMLGPGDDVVSPGLMPSWPGSQRNYPIFKFGRLSNYPDEGIELPPCTQGESPLTLKVWLMSLNQVLGSSGAAVFYAPSFILGAGLTNPKGRLNRPVLLGIQSISFAGSGADVAGMTPVSFLLEILVGFLDGTDVELTVGGVPGNRAATPVSK